MNCELLLLWNKRATATPPTFQLLVRLGARVVTPGWTLAQQPHVENMGVLLRSWEAGEKLRFRHREEAAAAMLSRTDASCLCTESTAPVPSSPGRQRGAALRPPKGPGTTRRQQKTARQSPRTHRRAPLCAHHPAHRARHEAGGGISAFCSPFVVPAALGGSKGAGASADLLMLQVGCDAQGRSAAKSQFPSPRCSSRASWL